MESLAKCVLPRKHTRSRGPASCFIKSSVDVSSCKWGKPRSLGKPLSLDPHPPAMLRSFMHHFCHDIRCLLLPRNARYFASLSLPKKCPMCPWQHGKYRHSPSWNYGSYGQRACSLGKEMSPEQVK